MFFTVAIGSLLDRCSDHLGHLVADLIQRVVGDLLLVELEDLNPEDRLAPDRPPRGTAVATPSAAPTTEIDRKTTHSELNPT